MRPRRIWLCPGLLLAACGQAVATTTPCPPQASATAPSALQGPLLVTASTGSAHPGQTILLTLTVTGPLTYMADCGSPLQVSISDATGVTVSNAIGDQPATGRCGTVQLAAGSSTTYSAAWTPDPSLPSGTYTATVELGGLSPVQLNIPVRTEDGGCG